MPGWEEEDGGAALTDGVSSDISASSTVSPKLIDMDASSHRRHFVPVPFLPPTLSLTPMSADEQLLFVCLLVGVSRGDPSDLPLSEPILLK